MRQCPKCSKRFLESNARVCDVDGAILDLIVVASERDRLVGTTILNRYAIDGVLGDGGMGVVYRARDTTGGLRYAVKVLRAEYSAEEDLVIRFEQEARAAAAVQSPHIVEIYDWGSLPDGSRFFVMEYLEGRSLGDLMARMPKPPGADRRQPLSEEFTIHIAKQIAEGLGAAHAVGIVHRDIKPDNFHIVRRPEDQYFVKILDFGIAKVQNSKAARTRTGSVFGTPHYMSPEQASGDRNIDATTDIYGLGVLMYEMVVGKIPFDADNLMGILTAHLYHTPLPPRMYPDSERISASFEAVILKCLAKTREGRYATMAELYDDLLACERKELSTALEDQECRTVRFNRNSIPDLGAEEPTRPAVSLPETLPALDPSASSSASAFHVPSVVVDTVAGVAVPPHPSPPPGVRSRVPLIAGVLGTGATIGVALFALLGVRQPAPASIQPHVLVVPTMPSSTTETFPHAPPTPTANTPTPVPQAPTPVPHPIPTTTTQLSTVMIVSDTPNSVVYRGNVVVGSTPLEVARPASGEDVYSIVAPGRERIEVRVDPTSARVLSVHLPRRSSRSAGRPGEPGSSHSNTLTPPTSPNPPALTPPRRPDLHNPWED